MFAVIKTGGKQYRVSEEDIIRIEKVASSAGDIIEFNDVLMIGEGDNVTVGNPIVVGAKVRAEVLEQVRMRKIIVFKKIRRHNYRRKNGHRQELSVLRVKEVIAA